MLPIDGKSSGMLPTTSLLTSAGAGASGKDTTVKDTFLDQNSLNSVKAMGRKNDPEALKQIAKKFEGMFVQQMLKSMREANEVFAEGDMFSSEEEKFHQDMLDQQMVLNLTSGKGIGLAASMYQQMQKIYGKGSVPAADGSSPEIKALMPNVKPLAESEINTNTLLTGGASSTATSSSATVSNAKVNVPPALISRAAITANASNTKANKNSNAQTPDEFIASLMPFAEKAAADLNVNTDVILAQAALETGWGKHLLQDGQGNSSFNVFNIKKGSSWDGKSVAVSSLEYKQGVAQNEHSEFRQYEGYTHSFSDYVDLLKNSPRYQRVLDAGSDSQGYAEELQKAGYATDPAYADKLKSLLNSDAIRSAVDGKNTTASAVNSTRG